MNIFDEPREVEYPTVDWIVLTNAIYVPKRSQRIKNKQRRKQRKHSK